MHRSMGLGLGLLFWIAGFCLALCSNESGDYAKLIRSHEQLLFYLSLTSVDEAISLAVQPVGKPLATPEGPGDLGAMRFDGQSGLVFSSTPQLDTEEGTIELWFRPEFKAPAPYNPCLIAKRESGDHRQTRWSIHIHGDYSGIDLWNGGQVAFYRWPGGPLEPSRWYHLAVTFSRSETRVYLNGVPCITESEDYRLNFGQKGRPLCIGMSQPAGAEFFTGLLAQVAIYGAALPAEQIALHSDALGFKEERLAVQEKYMAILEAQKEEQTRLEQAREKRRQELMNDPALFTRGEPAIYEGEHLTAVDLPVGGIGVGAIHMDGMARRHAWQIFGNVAYRKVPSSFFAILVRKDNSTFCRVLQTVEEGPFPPMQRLRLTARYPLARYDFFDENLPCSVSLEAFNPLVPTNLRDSAFPCAVYRITVKNPCDTGISVKIVATQLNVAGYRGDTEIDNAKHPAFGGNVNSLQRTDRSTRLVMSQTKPESSGDSLVLMMLDRTARGIPNWSAPEELLNILQDESANHEKDETAGPSPPGQTLQGALVTTLEIPPQESRSMTCVFIWYFRDLPAGAGAWSCKGRRYEAWWRNAEEIAGELEMRLDELEAATRLYVDSLYESNLPYWFLDRISSQVAILRSPTVFWCRDGYFGGWEGCNIDAGCCPGNCNHVWHYAQAHARLFPELGRLMREQEFRFQKPDGAIPHRQPNQFPACDGQCGAVLNSYREFLMSYDAKWLQTHWPAVKKAMEYIIRRWDADEDGVLSGPQWNTLDGELGGSTSWLGSLYLAALAAAEQMAIVQGDEEAVNRYQRIRLSGQERQDKTLFNGRYYIQIPDPTPHEDYLEGCGIDQLLGQWWAHQLDLGWIYPREHVQTALEHLFRYNFRGLMRGLPQRPRKFVADEDAGMQMFVWPEGARKPTTVIRYASEVMTGFEYAAAAAMIQAGLLREGFTVVRAISLRYDGRKRTDLTPGNFSSWGYSGNPFGDDECGKFYARAMSSWSLLLACQGFIYDGPAGKMGFAPVWRPEEHVSFFTGAGAWGILRQIRHANRQVNQIEVRWGQLPLKVFVTTLPPGAASDSAECRLGDRHIPIQVTARGDRIECHFAERVVLRAGEKLTVEFRF